MHRLQPILEETLGEKMVLPERKLDRMEAFLERFPDVKRVMIDRTERPIARPEAPETKQSTTQERRNGIPVNI